MAPFNTHFLVAELVWPALASTWQSHYDQFCFGCIAPDVDKVSATLVQKDTHFYDRSTGWDYMATHRSAKFIEHHAAFAGHPFDQLAPPVQAFFLGYLCHLCVDEVSKHRWRRETWLHFKDLGPGPAFAALDEQARRQIENYPAIVGAVQQLELLDAVPAIDRTDFEKLWAGLRYFVEADTTEQEFIALIKLFDQPTPERLQEILAEFRRNIDLARARIEVFALDSMVETSVERTLQRINDLQANRQPAPGGPL